MRRPLAVVGLILAFSGCGENLGLIPVAAPEQNTPAAACGVAPDALVTKTQARCIAKVAGLEPGVARWQVREYDTYIEVFSTTHRFPSEQGENVRIARRGGAVLGRSPWEAVTAR